jgi:hypothetical protein
VLAVDGVVVNRFREVERAVAEAEGAVVDPPWTAKEMKRSTSTRPPLVGEDVLSAHRVWAGAVLHMPHRPMPRNGAFRRRASSSLISRTVRRRRATAAVGRARRIVEVDGQPTPDLDAFLKSVSGREDRSSVRLRTVSWNGAPEVITLKLDKRYWPAYELRRTRSAAASSRRRRTATVASARPVPSTCATNSVST